MIEQIAVGIVDLLAAVGVVALAVRLGTALGRFMLGSAEIVAARTAIDTSARRGDLTSMQEARQSVLAGKRLRVRSIILAALWTAWIAIPPFAEMAGEAWALAAPLWLLPRETVRDRAASTAAQRRK